MARIETGIYSFGEDWPGYFIRGDQAIYLAETIADILTLIDAVKPDSDAADKQRLSIHKQTLMAHMVNMQMVNTAHPAHTESLTKLKDMENVTIHETNTKEEWCELQKEFVDCPTCKKLREEVNWCINALNDKHK